MEEIEFTGERMIPEVNRDDLIYAEHVSRYFFAGQFVQNKVVLDIACGSGYGSLYLSEKEAKKVVGVDNSQDAIDYAKSKYQKQNIEFLIENGEATSFKDDIFDVIVSNETIEHVNNQENFLKEIKRILTKEGVAVISTPNASTTTEKNIFHIKEFTPREFRGLLLRYFKNVKFYYQHNVISNYILSRESLTQNHKEVNLKSLKLAEPTGIQNIVAIMSDSELPKVTESIVLFSDRELELLRSELKRIRNYRWFKVLSFLNRVRKSIPVIRNI